MREAQEEEPLSSSEIQDQEEGQETAPEESEEEEEGSREQGLKEGEELTMSRAETGKLPEWAA